MALLGPDGKPLSSRSPAASKRIVGGENPDLARFLQERGFDPRGLDTTDSGLVTFTEKVDGMPSKMAPAIEREGEDTTRYLVISDIAGENNFIRFLPNLLRKVGYDAVICLGSLGYDDVEISTLLHTLGTNTGNKPVYLTPGKTESMEAWQYAFDKSRNDFGNLFDMVAHFPKVRLGEHNLIMIPGAMRSQSHRGGYLVMSNYEHTFTSEEHNVRVISLAEHLSVADGIDSKKLIVFCYDVPRFGSLEEPNSNDSNIEKKLLKSAVDKRDVAYITKKGTTKREGPYPREYGKQMEQSGHDVEYVFENLGDVELARNLGWKRPSLTVVSGNRDMGHRSCDYDGNEVDEDSWAPKRVYCSARHGDFGTGQVSLIEVKDTQENGGEGIVSRVSTKNLINYWR
ncbi:MAG: hypothetical protein ABIG89_01965 [Candidatus Woesearchaeota archaeon]